MIIIRAKIQVKEKLLLKDIQTKKYMTILKKLDLKSKQFKKSMMKKN